MTTNKTRSV